MDEDTWERTGDDIAEPLCLPPPPLVPLADEEASAVGSEPQPQASTSQITNAERLCSDARIDLTGPATRPERGPHPRLSASARAANHPTVQASGPSRPSEECLCCYDEFPPEQVTCAGGDTAGSSTAAAGCGHYFCGGCLTAYVCGAVRERKFPVRCPLGPGAAGGCGAVLSRGAVMEALADSPADQQAYGLLEAEAALGPGDKVYCPFKACSALLLKPEGDELPPDQPTNCPACRQAFCPRCNIAGWHTGYTCAAFQALPPQQRSAEDAALLRLSAARAWKQCPACAAMVERTEGCNHVRCRCGAAFCYACGTAYRDTRPTANNVHGTQACGCPLFPVPEEERQGQGQGAQVGQGQGAGAPRRGGRQVARARCRYSDSIAECPHGPRRCWFWHDEDGPM